LLNLSDKALENAGFYESFQHAYPAKLITSLAGATIDKARLQLKTSPQRRRVHGELIDIFSLW